MLEWRGPAPYFFVAVPADLVGEVHFAARLASYGWGCVPVLVSINTIEFRTSLMPRDGGYMLPLRADVRRRARIPTDGSVNVALTISAKA